MSNLISTNTQLAQSSMTVNDYIQAAKADNTRKAYQTDWTSFLAFCNSHGLQSMPATPETVAEYIRHLANKGYKSSTIQRHVSSISQAHQYAEYDSPTQTSRVRETLRGIKREHGTAPAAKKAAVVDDIRRMVDTVPQSKIGVRDRALLLIGFAGAFRRSELVSVNAEDIEITADGLVITLRHSKTDQEGHGRKIGIPYGSYRPTCPVRAYMAWIEVSDISDGAVFRSIDRHGNIKDRMSDKAVALIVKRCAESAGLNPNDYAGHSLRSGLATTAAQRGKGDRAIMKQTGHKSRVMLDRYIQDGSLFRDNAAADIGL